MEYAVEDDGLGDFQSCENDEMEETCEEEPIYQPMMKNNYSFYPGFRTRLLSCIEENDSDSHKSLPYDFMIEADETFKELIDDNQQNNEWEVDDIATLNESEIYKIESMEAINHCGQPQEVYWQTPTKAIPSIMTASCYGILPGVLHQNVGNNDISHYHEVRHHNEQECYVEKKEEPIYAVPDKRGRNLDFNASFDSSACQSQASSIYGGDQPFSSMTSSLDFNGRNVSSPMELSIISNDGQKVDWNDGDFENDEKCLEKINDDLQSIQRYLEHDTACPSCRKAFDKGKRRKIIDTCGHERCYSCLFISDQCPKCINNSLKDVDGSNVQGYDTGIGGSTSTIVSPIGSPQPQVRSHIRTTNATVLPKFMQNRQETISPDLRYASVGKLPKINSLTTGAGSSSTNTSSSTNSECLTGTISSFATPPPSRRKFFNHKNLKSALTGHRRTASNGGCPIDTSSVLSDSCTSSAAATASSAPVNNVMETSTCSDSAVTRRRRKNDLNSSNESNRSSNRLSLAGTSAQISSMVFGKIKSLWNVNTSNSGLNLLAGVDNKANKKDELRARLGLFFENGLRSQHKQRPSDSSSNVSPEQTLTGSSECDTDRYKYSNSRESDPLGSQLSVVIKDDISICSKFKALEIPRKSVVRRSARSTGMKNRNAIYQPIVQLPLKPLFFEVPLQEPDPVFIGRQWLLRELSNVLTTTETPGVLLNGNPGTGKTALILQLVEYSCFGRRKDVGSESDGIYCQINIGQDRLKALASHIVGYHFCQADNNSTCLVPDFVHSLSAQLCQAQQLTAYRDYLVSESHLQDLLSIKECIADPERVMRMAILEPLTILKKKGKITTKNCIILIDALCEAEYHRPDHGHTISTFLAKMTQHFPAWLKVVATVRTQMLDYVKGLSYTKMTLDSWASNDLLRKDILDYITFRVNHSTNIQNNIGSTKDSSTGQLKFVTHLQGLSKGSFLYAKSVLDLIEKGQLVIKAASYKVLPLTLGEIFLLQFNMRFPTANSFEKAAPILNVCLASLYPMTLQEIFYSICSLKTDDHLQWDEFLQRFKLLDGFLVKRLDNSYMFFHPSFREWLMRRDEKESNNFLCDFRLGHAAIGFRLSRLHVPLDPEKTLELGHHILKAHLYRNSQLQLSPRDMQSFWIASVTENISSALGALRNVYSPNIKVSRLLLLAGASPHYTTEFMGDATILCIAAHEGIVPMVGLLLEFGADVERTNSQGCTPLILAAMKGHCDVVRLLVAAGSSLGQTDTTQRCALVHAARMGRLNVAKYLMACDWNPRENSTDITFQQAAQQALHASAAQGHITIMEDLLEMDEVYINDIDSLNGETALTAAAKNGSLDAVSALISRGAKVNKRNKQGMTPLWLAVKDGHLAVADLLLQNGADIEESATPGNKTALMIAAEEGHIALLELLTNKGASLETEDHEGFTAMSWASLRGRQAAAKYLIDKGCNKDHADKNGRTPLDLAAYQGSASLVQYLLDQGAKIEHVDKNGMRPLDRAIACRNVQVVQVFLKRGAKLGPTTWNMAMRTPDILIILLNKLLEDGNILYRKNRFEDASYRYQYALIKISNIEQLKVQNQPIELDRNSIFNLVRANLLLNLSRCKRKFNRLDESVDLATQAIECKPKSYEGYFARSRARMEKGLYTEALSDANEALQWAAQCSASPDVMDVLKRVQNDLLIKISETNNNNTYEHLSRDEVDFQNESTDL